MKRGLPGSASNDGLVMSDQATIDGYSKQIISVFHGENSSIAIMAMLSAIESMALCEQATTGYRRYTEFLLREQADRIKAADASIGPTASH